MIALFLCFFVSLFLCFFVSLFLALTRIPTTHHHTQHNLATPHTTTPHHTQAAEENTAEKARLLKSKLEEEYDGQLQKLAIELEKRHDSRLREVRAKAEKTAAEERERCEADFKQRLQAEEEILQEQEKEVLAAIKDAHNKRVAEHEVRLEALREKIRNQHRVKIEAAAKDLGVQHDRALYEEEKTIKEEMEDELGKTLDRMRAEHERKILHIREAEETRMFNEAKRQGKRYESEFKEAETILRKAFVHGFGRSRGRGNDDDDDDADDDEDDGESVLSELKIEDIPWSNMAKVDVGCFVAVFFPPFSFRHLHAWKTYISPTKTTDCQGAGLKHRFLRMASAIEELEGQHNGAIDKLGQTAFELVRAHHELRKRQDQMSSLEEMFGKIFGRRQKFDLDHFRETCRRLFTAKLVLLVRARRSIATGVYPMLCSVLCCALLFGALPCSQLATHNSQLTAKPNQTTAKNCLTRCTS